MTHTILERKPIEIDYELPSISKIDYTLPLRGNNLNTIIDVATPLLGLVLRLQEVETLDDNPNLYQQVVTDILAIEQTLQDKRYEPGVIVTFRYVLCTFIDEIAMKRNWESQTNWRKESLLVHFHNEAWGGEKIFDILDRLIGEPHRYNELLNFFYLCFCLGLRGRYSINSENQDEFNKIFRRLHKLIESLNIEKKTIVLNLDFNKTKTNSVYKLSKKLTSKHFFLGGIFVLLLIYGFYAFKLSEQTNAILQQLNTLLK